MWRFAQSICCTNSWPIYRRKLNENQKTIVSRSVYVKNIPSFESYWNDDSTQCTAILQDIYNLLRESDHFVIDFSWIKELAQDRIHA